MTDSRRVPISARLAPADKRFLEEAAAAAGLDAGVAVRVMVEAVLRKCRAKSERDGSPSLLSVLAEL